MKILVVARHTEDTRWLTQGPDGWQPLVIQKGVDLPNIGREGSSFLHAIIRLYPSLRAADRVACVQGTPHDHDPDFPASLRANPWWYAPLGDHRTRSGPDGNPHHGGLPVAARHQEWLGRPMGHTVPFVAGGQFHVTGRAIRYRPRGFYRRLYEAAMTDPDAPWILERLWETIFERST